MYECYDVQMFRNLFKRTIVLKNVTRYLLRDKEKSYNFIIL